MGLHERGGINAWCQGGESEMSVLKKISDDSFKARDEFLSEYGSKAYYTFIEKCQIKYLSMIKDKNMSEVMKRWPITSWIKFCFEEYFVEWNRVVKKRANGANNLQLGENYLFETIVDKFKTLYVDYAKLIFETENAERRIK